MRFAEFGRVEDARASLAELRRLAGEERRHHATPGVAWSA